MASASPSPRSRRIKGIACGEVVRQTEREGQLFFVSEIETGHRLVAAASLAAVIANIRALAEEPSLDVTFGGTSGNPYSSKHPRKRMELYGDNRGMVYFVDPDTNQVIQFGPGPNSVITDDNTVRLSEAELRQRAEAYLAKHVPNFADVRRIQISGDVESRSAFAFRWEAPAKAAGEEMAAFVQVVLSRALELVMTASSPVEGLIYAAEGERTAYDEVLAGYGDEPLAERDPALSRAEWERLLAEFV